MHIAIDGRTIVQNRTGVGVYAERLVRALLQIDSRNTYSLFLLEDDPSIAGPNLTKVLVDRYSGIGPNRVWENFVLPRFLAKNRVDVYFSPAYVLPVLCRGRRPRGNRRTKFVVTLHDLVSYVYPETFTIKMKLWQRIFVSNAVRVADRILADSEATKRDILKYYEVDPDVIKVVFLPVGEQFHRITDAQVLASIRKKHELPEKFILYVGTLEPRKNVARLAQAYALLPQVLRDQFALVLAGAPGWLSEDIVAQIDSLHMPDRIRRIGYIDQQTLPAFYTLASAFAYLSVYEGFGAPPVESMACGTPVLCSNTSSLPEAVGDAAMLVDPYDVPQISAQLERLLTDQSMRDRLIVAGLARAAKFNALEIAREVLRNFEEVMAIGRTTDQRPSSPSPDPYPPFRRD